MDRQRDSRAGLIWIVGLALTMTLTAAPVAFAEATATDEYTLQLPGAREGVNPRPISLGGTEPARNRIQSGVAGENVTVQSPLGMASSLVGGPLVIGFVLCGLAWISFGRRQTRTRFSRPR